MAGNAVIGSLRVNLGLDSAAFSKGLKSAETRVSKFGNAMKAGLLVASAAGVAAMGALAAGIKNTIDAADEMSKMSQKFGVPVDELSRLKYAADLSGVSMDGLGTGLRKLSQNMQETANGAKNIASQAFEALGISVKNADGSLKSSSTVMTEIAGKLANMDDGAQKTATAMAIFGRSGADLIPMLNAGADGLAAMMAEADNLGIVISGSTGRAAEAFNDNLTRLGTVTDALKLKLTEVLLPALELLSEKFLAVVRDGDKIKTMADGLLEVFNFVANEVAQLAILSSRLSAEFAGIAEAFGRLKSGDFSGAWDAFIAGQEKSAAMAADLKKEIAGIFDGSIMSEGQIQRRVESAWGDTGKGAGETFVANFAAASTGKMKTALDPMVAEANRIFEATRTPLEEYQASIARLNELLAAGAINQETYNRAVFQAQDAFSQAEEAGKKTGSVMESIGQSISSSFANAFQGLIDGSKKVKDVLADLLKQFASMALNSAFKTLFSGGGSGGGGILGALFGGLNIPSFASGGQLAAGGASCVTVYRKRKAAT